MKYKISKDSYRTDGLHIGVHFGIKEQSYKVKFDNSCIYQPLNWENDYNKLCGWSYGFLPRLHKEGFSSNPDFTIFGVAFVWAHHYNSIRTCFRSYVPNTDNPDYYMPKQLELCIYVYEKGIRKLSNLTMVVDTDEDIKLSTKYDIFTNCITTTTTQSKVYTALMKYNIKPSWGYRLFPVFGGNDRSPHDMSIELERL